MWEKIFINSKIFGGIKPVYPYIADIYSMNPADN